MVPSIPVFAYLFYLNLSLGTGDYPAYSISNVNESGYRLVQKTVIGNTVEHITSYIDEYEYTLTIDVTQNNDTDSTDSYLVVECFLADTYVHQVLVPLFDVVLNSDLYFYLLISASGRENRLVWILYFYTIGNYPTDSTGTISADHGKSSYLSTSPSLTVWRQPNQSLKLTEPAVSFSPRAKKFLRERQYLPRV